jgi:glyoxylase-like metal-dependent hydrolase (beta-lactamase superfamily II)
MGEDRNQDLIRYEFDKRPDAGDTMQVAPGVHWLRMPLPFALGHINLWLLEDGDSWTIVDTGVDVEESEKVWAKTFLETMDSRPVNRVLVTHLHPDHVGCAGMLCEKTGAELWMTREEYLLCRILVADTGRTAPDEGTNFYSAAGFPDDALHHYEKMFGFFGKFVSHIPESYHRLIAGDEITIGRNRWKVLVGRGHSPEHACLYCEEQNLLISGDQLLPTISSNVSVYPTEPHANPLHGWMTSLAEVKNSIHEDVLVLPAHGKPFRGAHERLDALILEHRDGLDELEAWCSEPRRAIDAFPALFKRKINDGNLIMATGEAIAHLNYLMNQGRVLVEADADGVNWYRQA